MLFVKSVACSSLRDCLKIALFCLEKQQFLTPPILAFHVSHDGKGVVQVMWPRTASEAMNDTALFSESGSIPATSAACRSKVMFTLKNYS